jgi:hypothetical protein
MHCTVSLYVLLDVLSSHKLFSCARGMRLRTQER